MRTASILLFVILTSTGGEVGLARVMKKAGEVQRFSPRDIFHFVRRCSLNMWLWASVALLAASFYGFLTMLSWYPISFVVPATSLSYVAGPLAAKFMLRERLSIARWMGVTLICLGVALAWVNRLPALPSAGVTLVWLRAGVFVAAGVSLLFYLISIWAAWRFFGGKIQTNSDTWPGSYTPAVSILKAVRGLDRGAYENFASFCRQDYPRYEILFAAGDESDPAVPVIRQIMRDFPERSIRLLLGVEGQGTNDKVAKLCHLTREANYSVLVVSDSDVRVAPNYLRDVVAPLADARVGMVTALYRSLDAPSFGAAMDTVGSSASFAGAALVARTLEGLKFAMGSTIAITRDCLEEVGGFACVLDRHSDDYEIGRRIADQGYRLELAPEPVDMAFPSESVGDYLRHELRWLVGIRHIRPGGHFGLLMTQGLAWSIAAALLAPSGMAAAAWLGAYLGVRLTSGYVVGVWGLRDPVLRRKLWLLPLHDFFTFFVWLASFVVNRIEWRGLIFTLEKGRMVPVTIPSSTASYRW